MSLSLKAEKALDEAYRLSNSDIDRASILVGVAIGYGMLKVAEEIYGLRETYAVAHGLVAPKRR